MQELTAKSLRMMDELHSTQMDAIAKQQYELILGTIMGRHMRCVVVASIILIGCCRTVWYKAFIAVYYRSRGHHPIVGLHYFLVQSACRSSIASASIFLSFAFSVSSALSRLASGISKPPNLRRHR